MKNRPLLFAFLVVLVFFSLWVLRPFLVSLALGSIFGIALVRIQERVSLKFEIHRKIVAAAICLLFVVFLLMPLMFVSYKAFSYAQANPDFAVQVSKLETKFSSLIAAVTEKLSMPVEVAEIRKAYASATQSLKAASAGLARRFFVELPEALLQIAIMVLTIFMVLTNYRQIIVFLVALPQVSRDTVMEIRQIVSDVCHTVVFSNLITGLIQASLVSMGAFAFTDIDPVVIFVITFLTSFIPVIGAAPIAILLAFYEMLDRSYTAASLLLVLSIIVGVSDNIVRAMLMSQKKEDSAFFNLLATIGGIYLWGVPGLFMGPFVMSLSFKLIPLIARDLINQPPQFEKVESKVVSH